MNLDNAEALTLIGNFSVLGEGTYGLRDASELYFGRSLDIASPAQQALLVASMAAPSRSNPCSADDRFTERARSLLEKTGRSGAQISEALDSAQIPVDSKQITRIPQNTVDLDVDTARKVLKLMEALEDNEDVQNVTANFNIPDEIMEAMINEA